MAKNGVAGPKNGVVGAGASMGTKPTLKAQTITVTIQGKSITIYGV